MIFLTGLGAVVPPRRYTQAECWEGLSRSPQCAALQDRSRNLLRKVLLGQNGIESRHFVVDALDEVFHLTPDILLGRFLRHAPALAEQAARAALEDAGVSPSALDAVVIATCTGYLCPGLTSYVGERLGVPATAHFYDLVGQGCGAAIPAMRTAAGLIAAGQSCRVLVVCVEIGSAAFYLDDDPGVLISACLFGDGAAAAVFSPEPNSRWARQVRWISSHSLTFPEIRDKLRFDHREGFLRNLLAPDVPELAGRAAREVFDQASYSLGISRSEITNWIWHPGGRDVLRALAETFQLEPESLRWSAEVLRRFGNMSSPSCLFALKDALQGGAEGGKWWMASFGAGFSSHGALLEVG